jgi:hypothetical protein
VFTGGHLKGTILRDGDATSDQRIFLEYFLLNQIRNSAPLLNIPLKTTSLWVTTGLIIYINNYLNFI